MRRDCPPSETLATAAAAESGKADAAIVAHLSTCDDCAQEFRLARSLEPWALAAAARLRAPAATRPAPARWGALAAGLCVLSLGLGGSYWRLRGDKVDSERRLSAERDEAAGRTEALKRQVDALQAPQVNVPIVELRPETTLRGSAVTPEVEAPRGASSVVLVIRVWAKTESSEYGVEIADERGAKIWTGAGFVRGANGTVTLAVPSAVLPSGNYHVGLLGVGPAGSTLLQASSFRITYR